MTASNYWQVLGLEEATQDKKAIKKAYAVQLKKHRPDEDPEGFKRLRKAYEFALAQIGNSDQTESTIEWRDIEDVLVKDDRVEINLLDDSEEPQQPTEFSLVEKEDIEINEDEHLKIVEQEILTHIHALLENTKEANDPSNWTFISDCPELFNPEFNWALGVKVFACLNALIPKHFILKEGVPLPINLHVIIYLDGVFNWMNQSLELQETLESDEYNVLFRILAFSEDYAHFNRGHGVKGGRVTGDQDAQTSIQSVGSIFYVMAMLIAGALFLAMMYVN